MKKLKKIFYLSLGMGIVATSATIPFLSKLDKISNIQESKTTQQTQNPIKQTELFSNKSSYLFNESPETRDPIKKVWDENYFTQTANQYVNFSNKTNDGLLYVSNLTKSQFTSINQISKEETINLNNNDMISSALSLETKFDSNYTYNRLRWRTELHQHNSWLDARENFNYFTTFSISLGSEILINIDQQYIYGASNAIKFFNEDRSWNTQIDFYFKTLNDPLVDYKMNFGMRTDGYMLWGAARERRTLLTTLNNYKFKKVYTAIIELELIKTTLNFAEFKFSYSSTVYSLLYFRNTNLLNQEITHGWSEYFDSTDGLPIQPSPIILNGLNSNADYLFEVSTSPYFNTINTQKISYSTSLKSEIISIDISTSKYDALVAYSFVKNQGTGNVFHRYYEVGQSAPENWTNDGIKLETNTYHIFLDKLEIQTEYFFEIKVDDFVQSKKFRTQDKVMTSLLLLSVEAKEDHAIFTFDYAKNDGNGLVWIRIYDKYSPPGEFQLIATPPTDGTWVRIIPYLNSGTEYFLDFKVESLEQPQNSIAFKTLTSSNDSLLTIDQLLLLGSSRLEVEYSAIYKNGTPGVVEYALYEKNSPETPTFKFVETINSSGVYAFRTDESVIENTLYEIAIRIDGKNVVYKEYINNVIPELEEIEILFVDPVYNRVYIDYIIHSNDDFADVDYRIYKINEDPNNSEWIYSDNYQTKTPLLLQINNLQSGTQYGIDLRVNSRRYTSTFFLTLGEAPIPSEISILDLQPSLTRAYLDYSVVTNGNLGFVEYKVYEEKEETSEWITIGNMVDGTHKFTIQNLISSTDYIFEIRIDGGTPLSQNFRTL